MILHACHTLQCLGHERRARLPFSSLPISAYHCQAGLAPALTTLGCIQPGCIHVATPVVWQRADHAACTAAGLPALYGTVSRVLSTLLDRFTSPRHLGLLLDVSLLAFATLEGAHLILTSYLAAVTQSHTSGMLARLAI
jgi:hypothetical protein